MLDVGRRAKTMTLAIDIINIGDHVAESMIESRTVRKLQISPESRDRRPLLVAKTDKYGVTRLLHWELLIKAYVKKKQTTCHAGGPKR